MTTRKIALIDTTGKVGQPYLETVAKALTTQVKRDFADVWNVTADVIAANQVPAGYWPIYVVSELDLANAFGYHYLDANNVPFAKVLYRDNWTLTASHEMLEMLVNPYLNKYQVTDISTDLPGDENFLVEVAGPVQSINFSYRIDNVVVSDFMYPAYFDLLYTEGKKYDHLGVIKKPRSILEGGYVSFIDNVGQWWQAFMIQNVVDLRKLVDGTATDGNIKRVLRGILYGAASAVGFYVLFKISKLWFRETTATN